MKCVISWCILSRNPPPTQPFLCHYATVLRKNSCWEASYIPDCVSGLTNKPMMYQKLLNTSPRWNRNILVSLTYKIMFSLLRLRLSLLLLGPDVLTPTYRTLLRGFLFFFFHPGSHLCRQFAELLLLLRRIQISPTLPRRWPRIPSDASKRSSEKTQDCCRIPLTLRFKCLGVSGSFLNGYATPTDILS